MSDAADQKRAAATAKRILAGTVGLCLCVEMSVGRMLGFADVPLLLVAMVIAIWGGALAVCSGELIGWMASRTFSGTIISVRTGAISLALILALAFIGWMIIFLDVNVKW